MDYLHTFEKEMENITSDLEKHRDRVFVVGVAAAIQWAVEHDKENISLEELCKVLKDSNEFITESNK